MINIIAFTKNGVMLSKKIRQGLEKNNCSVTIACKSKHRDDSTAYEGINSIGGDLKEYMKNIFLKGDAIVFISAMGIAVRTIAPFIAGKDRDPAVICIDELGQFVIPILSGHIGGANSLANELVKIIDATLVITTATDINNKFAVDRWAVENDFSILNIEEIKSVSSSLLENKTVGLCTTFEILTKLPENIILTKDTEVGICISSFAFLKNAKKIYEKTLNIVAKCYSIGIGCRKEIGAHKLEEFILKSLEENQIIIEEVKSISSIELKKHEKGIIDFCKKYGVDFITFSKEELLHAKGVFTKSDFVLDVTGVDNVCERSAVLAADNIGQLILHKKAMDGMTIAIAKIERRVSFENYNGGY